MTLNRPLLRKPARLVCLAMAALCARLAPAQHLTLEGQTGGFLTPTAYVVPSEKGQTFSHPAVGYHFINASAVLGLVHTVSVTEGVANRAEFGYTRVVHGMGLSLPLRGAAARHCVGPLRAARASTVRARQAWLRTARVCGLAGAFAQKN